MRPTPTNPTPSQLAEITFLRTRISSTHKTRDALKQSLNQLINQHVHDSSDLSTLLFHINEYQAAADFAFTKIRNGDYEYWTEAVKNTKSVRERCVREYEEFGRKIERVKREIGRLEREIWEFAKMLSELEPSGGSLDGGRNFESWAWFK